MEKKTSMIDTINLDFESIVNNIANTCIRNNNVHSNTRDIKQGNITIPKGLEVNTKLKMDGIELLTQLDSNIFPVVFFDPQ